MRRMEYLGANEMASTIFLGTIFGHQEPAKGSDIDFGMRFELNTDDTGSCIVAIIAKGNAIEGIEAKK